MLVANRCMHVFMLQDGSTALILASKAGNTEIVQLLVQNNDTINIQNQVCIKYIDTVYGAILYLIDAY